MKPAPVIYNNQDCKGGYRGSCRCAASASADIAIYGAGLGSYIPVGNGISKEEVEKNGTRLSNSTASLNTSSAAYKGPALKEGHLTTPPQKSLATAVVVGAVIRSLLVAETIVTLFFLCCYE
jgi:hypothetical protein